MTLYLTYDNQQLQDGYGAQLMRIIGIYSLAKKFGLKYVHSPILDTVEELSHNVSSPTELESLTRKVNEFFLFPSCANRNLFDEVINVKSLGLRFFFQSIFRYKFSRKHILIRILLPFPVIERIPNTYKIGVRHIKQVNQAFFKNSPARDLVVHVRMGYGQSAPIAPHVRPRYLPISYYIDLLKARLALNPDERNVELFVHTDMPRNSRTWNPTEKRLRQNIEFGERIVNGAIDVMGKDLSMNFKELGYPKLQVCQESPFFEAFLDMAQASRLIMSRSSFSYLAALFNENEVVWPSNYWHVKLPRWKSSGEFLSVHNYELIPG